jgi:hypothetical protein
MIETTRLGSLPRGREPVPLLLAGDRGEAYDGADPAATWKRLAAPRSGADIAEQRIG